jgi:signal peptidase II
MNKWIWIFSIFGLVGIDQGSKYLIVNFYPELLVKNFGSAFSMPIPRMLTIALTIVFVAFIIYLKFYKKEGNDLLWAIALSGGVGNFIDRVSLGYVIDFINLKVFPVFNIADIYLTVSAGLLLYIYFVKEYKND